MVRIFIAFCVLASALIFGDDAGWAQSKTPVRAAYIPTIAWLPAFVAKEKGIFADLGLDVTMTATQNVSALPGTLGRQLDVAPSTPPDLIKSAASGLDVVAIAGQTHESSAKRNVELIVRADSGINAVEDLKGKVLAAPSLGAINHVSVLFWLKKSGMDPDAIRGVEVPFPNMADQLKAKRVDAVEAIQPFVGPMLAAGNVSIGDPILAVADPSLYTIWIASGAWAKANAPAVKAWSEGLRKGAAFIEANPREARVILGKYTNLPEAVVQNVPFPEYVMELKPEGLEVWIRTLRELDQLPRPVDAGSMIVKAN